jgi:hypothetical protein
MTGKIGVLDMAQEKLLLALAVLILVFLAVSSKAEERKELLAEKVAEVDRYLLQGLIEKCFYQ